MPHPTTDPDIRLRAFRVAAQQVRDTGPIATGARVHFSAGKPADALYHEEAQLLDPDGFRSLAMAVRQVYLPKNLGSFPRVCQTLKRRVASPDQAAVQLIRERYDALLDKSGTLFQGPVNGKLRKFTARQVFDTWINSRGFHYDHRRQPDHDALNAVGLYFQYILQAIVLQLAGCIMDLDDLVADALSEPRMTRIGP